MKEMDDRELCRDLHEAISESSFSCSHREKLGNALDEFFKRAAFYAEVALHGRDSDDANSLRKCQNDEQDFIRLDLEP